MKLRILAVSDDVDQRIYNSSVRDRMGDVDMVIGCGDLPASYLEFLSDALLRPVYYVLGNHAEELTRAGERGTPKHPEGCIDLGGKVVRDPGSGLILAGLPGSVRYSQSDPVQYTEWEMRWMILKMAPLLFYNRMRYGRAVDILVTHSPPRHVGDREDPAHQGFIAMRRFLRRFRPAYQLHGHVHLYDRSKPNVVRFMDTDVINVFPYQRLELVFEHLRSSESTSTAASTSDRSAPEVEQSP
ncbi:MAG TPA: metallophosphoesterase [Thermomicrobiales bacterium]|nr:metallophosphoesterase [Thermomicrobiales bacterium]